MHYSLRTQSLFSTGNNFYNVAGHVSFEICILAGQTAVLPFGQTLIT